MMKRTRASFKLAVRKCRKEKDRHAADSLAMNLLSKNTKQFWQGVKKVSGKKVQVQATTINNATGERAIADMWKEHYKQLLNSSNDNTMKPYVQDRLADTIFTREECL